MENLDRYDSNASAETKIRLLGSIFDEEIEFDGKNYRTSNFNSVLGYIYENANELRGKTETGSPVISGKSALVALNGLLSNQFLEDLDALWALRPWIPDPSDPSSWK